MQHPVQTDAAPAAIGPYSQAVRCEGLLYTSGQVALDPRTGVLVGSDVTAQAEQALANLQAVLQAGGSDLTRVLKTTVFLTTMDHFPAMNEVYARWFSTGTLPARSTVAVAGLPKGALFEIEAVARTESVGADS